MVAFAIIALALYYWYITIPIIVAIVLLWKYSTRNSNEKEDDQSRRSQSSSYQNYSNEKEDDQSRRSQSSSYQNYSESDYSRYNSNSNDYYKKNTQDHSYQKSKGKSKRKSRSKSKASQAKSKRVNDRLEKYKITTDEAKIIFGRSWRAKLGKQEWEFYYSVRYIEIDIEFDYNNRARKKFGHLYSKVLQIIQIVMEENADMREEEGKQYNKYSYDDFNWNDDDYDYKNYHYDSETDEKDIAKAFDTFGLTRESTKEQIKTKYRELTLKFHPDKNKSKNTTVKMIEINRAYEIIMGAIA
jgi:hypothetical protein